jgi:hypothetical protein
LAVDNISSETDSNEKIDFKILSVKQVDLTINTAKEILELEPRKLTSRHMSMFDFKTQFNEGKRTKSPKKIENLYDLSRRGRNFTKDLSDRSRASSRASAASRYFHIWMNVQNKYICVDISISTCIKFYVLFYDLFLMNLCIWLYYNVCIKLCVCYGRENSTAPIHFILYRCVFFTILTPQIMCIL